MRTRSTNLTVTAIVFLLMLGTMVVTPSQNLNAQGEPVVVYGWVFDDRNGNGIWDESVELLLDGVQVDLHDVSSLDPVSYNTSGGGYFKFEISQPSYYKITIDPPGKSLDESRVYFGNETGIVRVQDENVNMGRIGLESRKVNAIIRGSVTNGATGEPVYDATVTLRDRATNFEISEATSSIHRYENRRDKWMISPAISLPDSLNIKLKFKHWYSMEEGGDGGNIQLSTDGGVTWAVMTPSIDYPNSNVVDGQPGFTGDTMSQWRPVSVELTPFAKSTIQFAFRFTSDTTTTDEGWYIDDICIEVGGVPEWCDDGEIGDSFGWTFEPESDRWQISDYRSYSSSHSWYCGLDIEGWYSISTYDGSYEIEVSHPDYSPTFETVVVMPNNIIGYLKNRDIGQSSETLYLNGSPIPSGNYTMDYQNGTVSFALTIKDTDEVTADYSYTASIENETLMLHALGGEQEGWLAHGNITSADLYLDGVLWNPVNYALNTSSGYVNYSAPLTTGSVIWANYTYDSNISNYELLTNASVLSLDPILGTETVQINGIPTLDYSLNSNGEIWLANPVYYTDAVTVSYDSQVNVTGENVQLAGGTRADLELFTFQILGIALKADGGTGITDRPIHVALYDVNHSRITTSTTPIGPLFSIGAYPGTFLLVVRIDGYKTVTIPSVTVNDSNVSVSDRYFEKSQEERIDTKVTFENDDWNTISVFTTWQLNSESYLQGMDHSELHNVRMQIDIALGDGDGNLSASEVNDFKTWLEAKGPRYVMTDEYFLVDGNHYISDHVNYSVVVTATPSSVDSTEPIWVNTTTKYNTSGIQSGLDEYEITQYVEYDTSVMGRTEKNRTYRIDLPTQDGKRYELVENDTTPGIDVRGFLNIRIDPPEGSGDPVPVDMVVRPSVHGTAKIEIVDPLDRVDFPEPNPYTNYSATVPAGVNITFSAETSIDNSTLTGFVSPFANFTWLFDKSNPSESTRYNMTPIFNYTSGGEYTVNLTISESGLDVGGDVSYREATIFVDELDPEAHVSVNITALESYYEDANGETIEVNESMTIRFSSEKSIDFMYGNAEGEIKDWKWDLESDGTWDEYVKDFTHSFDLPGNYTVNLTVADKVGHWSSNVSIHFIVRDITPPSARLTVLNETDVPSAFAIENKTFIFNASESGDNLDDIDNLTFEWDFGDGTVIPAQLANYNVTHMFNRVDTYNVTLNVTDRAGNTGNITLTLKVNPDTAARPDIEVLSDTFSSEPESVEEGQRIKLAVNVTNKQNHATARNVEVHFYLKEGDKEKEIGSGTLKFYNESGQIPAGQVEIPAEGQVRAEISWTPEVVGKLTIVIEVSDAEEHSEQIGPDNRMTDFVTVKQAPWKTYLVYIVLVAVIILVIVVVWLRRKWQRGELKFRRREKEVPKEKKKKK